MSSDFGRCHSALAALIWRGCLLAVGELDREQDVVGVGAHDALDLVRLEVLLRVRLDVQDDLGAARHALGRSSVAGATSKPAPPEERHTHASLAAGLPARHLDAVGHHERRVEADAELADQAGAVLGLGEPAQEGARAGAGDGAEVVDQLLAVHADAGVGDRERAGRRRPA